MNWEEAVKFMKDDSNGVVCLDIEPKMYFKGVCFDDPRGPTFASASIIQGDDSTDPDDIFIMWEYGVLPADEFNSRNDWRGVPESELES